jgi:hypothetical protein
MLLARAAEMMMLSAPLRSMIINRTQDTVELNNNVRIELRPAAQVNLRGLTSLCVLIDEAAFLYTDDYANADTAILAAARPSLLTSQGPLVMISSAFAKKGELYAHWLKYFRSDAPPDILVAHATSRDLNPSLPQEEIDRALERDPIANRAEFLSEFRSDIEGFIAREIVEACVGDYVELPPQPGVTYRCGVDHSSGIEGGDSFAIAISHKTGDNILIDAAREVRPPFNPAIVVNEAVLPLCKSYGNIHTVYADHYAVGFIENLVRSAGLHFEPTTKTRSELYLSPLTPLLNSRRITLPRSERLVNQICALERSVVRSGRDTVDHPRGGHDDVANAVAIAAELAHSYTAFCLFQLVDGEPRASQLSVERDAEQRRKQSDEDARQQMYRKLGLPVPPLPWGIPRSTSSEQERADADANWQWRWMMQYGVGMF